MKTDMNRTVRAAMKYCRISLLAFFTLALFTPNLYAQGSQTPDTCKGTWQVLQAKVPGSKLTLSLVSTQAGNQQLQWTAHKSDLVQKYIYMAKGPVNAKGEIEICSNGRKISTFTDSNSILLSELVKGSKLTPRYYAIRIVIGAQDDPNVRNPGVSSDWITVLIK
jgi:hypothetical protein